MGCGASAGKSNKAETSTSKADENLEGSSVPQADEKVEENSVIENSAPPPNTSQNNQNNESQNTPNQNAAASEPQQSDRCGDRVVHVELLSGEALEIVGLPSAATYAEVIVRLEKLKLPPMHSRYVLLKDAEEVNSRDTVEGDVFTAIVRQSCVPGDRVYAKYNDAYFLGKIETLKDDVTAVVGWDEDGGTDEMPLERVYLAEEVVPCGPNGVAVGDHVFAQWVKTCGIWPSELWPGTITKLNADGTALMQWEDGSDPSAEVIEHLHKHGRPCWRPDLD